MAEWNRVAELAAEQHGVVSRAQLLDLGFSERSATRLLSDRGWARLHPGVYRLPGSGESFSQSVMAAQLALPVVAVATAATAAHLYELVKRPSDVDLLVGEDDRLVAPKGVKLTRSRTLLRSDYHRVDSIEVATPCRMLFDFAGRRLPEEVRALMIDARQKRLVEPAQIAARLETIGPVKGRGVIRRLLWEMESERCDSVLEARVRKLLRNAGIPAPAPAPVPVTTRGRQLHVDIGWPERRVGIEVDGFAFHSARSDLEMDHRRLNALTLAGWTVLRVGWDRLERDQHRFVREVRALVTKVW